MNLSSTQTLLTMLASLGGIAGILGYLRGLFLDKLLSGLSATQRDYALRGLLALMNYGTILGGLLAQGSPMSGSLLVEATKLTAGAVFGGHLLFTGLQKSTSAATIAVDASYPEIPDGGPSIPPTPPTTDTPAAAALAAPNAPLAEAA